jgi:hypothetical protein
MKGKQFPDYGGVWNAELDTQLGRFTDFNRMGLS